MFIKLRTCLINKDPKDLKNYLDMYIRESEITSITDVSPTVCSINLDHCKQSYYVYLSANALSAKLNRLTSVASSAPAGYVYEGSSI